MPLYLYACIPCGHRFEELVLSGETPRCPRCETAELERLPAMVAVRSGGGEPAPAERFPGPCGTCGDPRGPGSCAAG